MASWGALAKLTIDFHIWKQDFWGEVQNEWLFLDIFIFLFFFVIDSPWL